MEQTGRSLSPAATQVALRSQWEAFQDGGTIVSGVRSEIADSWRRSAASRLRPGLMAAPVDEAALRGFEPIPTHPSARQQFMAASTRLADNLVAELEDAVAVVVVCDDFGVVLYRAGRPEVLRRADNVNLIPGGVWSERMAGTNGIGLALEHGGSAHVYAAEHYIQALHAFSCTAAIVRHPVTREALGVLGLATDTSVSGALARPLIVRAARDVERLLENEVFGRERELLEYYLRSRAGRPTPFLTVDRAGHTVIQNARMLQSATGEDVQLLLSIARHAQRRGRHLRGAGAVARAIAGRRTARARRRRARGRARLAGAREPRSGKRIPRAVRADSGLGAAHRSQPVDAAPLPGGRQGRRASDGGDHPR